jgi:O-methyltransferase
MNIRHMIRRAFRATGYELARAQPAVARPSQQPAQLEFVPPELASFDVETVRLVSPYTMTSRERLFSLIKAVRYLGKHNIPGAIVECGVWKGGSMMAAARTLLDSKDVDRQLFLYDTFEGMPPPTKDDVDHAGRDAQGLLDTTSHDGCIWAKAPLDFVRNAMASTSYEPSCIHFIQGKVEDTIPASIPGSIALLRLDTDWYESTRHELDYLFPRLVCGGVLIIDDYGHWQGARKAVDEYFAEHGTKILLNIIDYSGRIGVKVQQQDDPVIR